MRGAIATLARKFRRLENIDKQYRYWARVGEIFLDAPSGAFESFLAGRRNRRGQNLHAVAMARLRRSTPQQISEWGRRSAEVRRQKRTLSAATGPTSSPSVASASESATASALESE